MEIRTLHPDEREGLLALLDGWDLGPHWRGRDFFRRYVEDDASYRDENVWVAVRDGAPVSCVQIFPRLVRVGAGAVPLGGIGSVFTAESARKQGTAGLVLARALEDMRERGMVLSLLFAARIAWYESLGWHRWPVARALYTRAEGAPAAAVSPPAGVELADFHRARDLASAVDLHARYGGGRPGSALRDFAAWEGNLRFAGNPQEIFRVARRGGEVVAYARFYTETVLTLGEFGRREGAADALAALIEEALVPRDGDPLALPERPSRELRSGIFGAAPADAEFVSALEARGLAARPLGDPSAMLRCLDPGALCRAAGLEAIADESETDLLARACPPEDFLYWHADRF